MLVKICGMLTSEAVQQAATNGADFIGFVFAPSKRQIDPRTATQISASLPASTKKVGVFVNQAFDEIIQIAEQVELDIIQLHGDESPDFAERLPYPIIKAFSMKQENLTKIANYPCDYYLLDSPIGTNRGGNGTTFDWNLLTNVKLDPEKVILAGGLTPENVQKAVDTTKPAGVDVSSGVETNGQKDLFKIKQFIMLAKRKG